MTVKHTSGIRDLHGELWRSLTSSPSEHQHRVGPTGNDQNRSGSAANLLDRSGGGRDRPTRDPGAQRWPTGACALPTRSPISRSVAMMQTLVLALGLLVGPALALAHEGSHGMDQRLPTLGMAPEFALTSQDGVEISLESLGGKVIAVAFIYTNCPDVCSVLTAKMVSVQDALGPAFSTDVAFVSITVDPERDTPEVLKNYAKQLGADLAGWSFLTGNFDAVRDAALGYGVVILPATKDGEVDHNTLTTLIDRNGTMRVKYIGSRFDPEEFRRDLLGLVNEP